MEQLKIIDVWDPRADDLMVVTRGCGLCGGETDIKVSEYLYKMWRRGTLIQSVWPHVSSARREALITGYHSPCFDDLFKDDDA